MSAAEDLLLGGFNARTPWKADVELCSTTNLTLSGEQTIDGGSATSGMRVLAAGQTAARERLIYIVSTGLWKMAKDFSNETSAQLGTTVVVARGTSNSGVWRLTSPVVKPIRPGETALTWTKVSTFDGSGASAGSTLTGDPDIALDAPTGEITGTTANGVTLTSSAAAGHIALETSGAGSNITVQTMNGGGIVLGTANGTISINSDGEALTIAGGATSISGSPLNINTASPVDTTIGSGTATGTTTQRFLGRNVDVRGSLTTSLDGPTTTIGGTYATAIQLGRSASTLNVDASTLDVECTGLDVDVAGNGTIDTTGNLTLTAGSQAGLVGEGVDITATGTNIVLTADASVEFSSGGTYYGSLYQNYLGFSNDSLARVAIRDQTTDTSPKGLVIEGDDAWASATGANKIGGGIDLIPGKGSVPGTDLGGPVRIGLSRQTGTNSPAFEIWRADSSDVQFGTAGHRLMKVHYVSGYTYVEYQDAGLYGVAYLTGTYTAVTATSYGGVSAGSFLYLRSTTGKIQFTRADGVVRQLKDIHARVTTTNATPTVVGTAYSEGATMCRVLRGTVVATSGSDASAWTITAVVKDNGSSLSFLGTPSVALVTTGSQDAGLSTTALTVTASAGTIVVTATGIAATTIVWSCNWEEHR